MCGLVISTEAHIALQGPESTRATLLNSGVLGAFFSRAPWPCCPWSTLLHFHDSKHAASVCLGTVSARTNVQLGLACQRLLLQIQVRLRLTMQHIYSHAQNFGNECADHAAALGASDVVSNQNMSARWASSID